MKNREKITKHNNSKNHTKIKSLNAMSVARNFFVPFCVNCVYCVNRTKFGLLILRIIIKIDATRCQILRLKCTKIVFGFSAGAPPQIPLGELTTPLRPPSRLGGDRRLGRLHSHAFGTRLAFAEFFAVPSFMSVAPPLFVFTV